MDIHETPIYSYIFVSRLCFIFSAVTQDARNPIFNPDNLLPFILHYSNHDKITFFGIQNESLSC